MDRDTAARALADAYTVAREAFGKDHAPGVALDTGRLMEQWLHDHKLRVVFSPCGGSCRGECVTDHERERRRPHDGTDR